VEKKDGTRKKQEELNRVAREERKEKKGRTATTQINGSRKRSLFGHNVIEHTSRERGKRWGAVCPWINKKVLEERKKKLERQIRR